MKTACVACAKFNLKAHHQHAALGFGRCMAMPTATFVSIKRELPCDKFQPAKPGAEEARKVWWAKRE